MGSFTVDLRRFKLDTAQKAEKVVRKIALDLLTMVVTASPVDTGRFRHNNQISLNSLPGTVLLGFDKSGTATIASGDAKLGAYRLGDTIFIYNNVEYGIYLEFGRDDGRPGSVLAPNGVFRISVQSLVNHFSAAGLVT